MFLGIRHIRFFVFVFVFVLDDRRHCTTNGIDHEVRSVETVFGDLDNSVRSQLHETPAKNVKATSTRFASTLRVL